MLIVPFPFMPSARFHLKSPTLERNAREYLFMVLVPVILVGAALIFKIDLYVPTVRKKRRRTNIDWPVWREKALLFPV
jgi:hypothetical protein